MSFCGHFYLYKEQKYCGIEWYLLEKKFPFCRHYFTVQLFPLKLFSFQNFTLFGPKSPEACLDSCYGKKLVLQHIKERATIADLSDAEGHNQHNTLLYLLVQKSTLLYCACQRCLAVCE